MSKPSSQIIAIWVKAEVVATEWRQLELVIVDVITKKWTGHSLDEVLELAEDNIAHIAEHLRSDMAEAQIDGAICPVEIDDEPSPYVRATGIASYDLLDKLRKIDPFVAEDICAMILTKFGGSAETTQRTVDGGIDFIAHGINIVPGALLVPERSRAVVIGQTKRYKDGNAISETKLREFVGAAILRRNVLTREGRVGPLTPVIFAFWTTSDFEPNAKRYARECGLWFMDGRTLASYADTLGLRDFIMNLADA